MVVIQYPFHPHFRCGFASETSPRHIIRSVITHTINGQVWCDSEIHTVGFATLCIELRNIIEACACVFFYRAKQPM